MSLMFCANLSFMFQETTSVLERYLVAKQSGFRAVECAFLYAHPLQQVVEAKRAAVVQQVLINVDPGNLDKGELGFAALPGQQDKFRESLQRAVTYCKALDCKIIHIMAGKVPNPSDENDRVYQENLVEAEALLKKENIVGVIEPINKISIPGYYLNDYRKALNVVKKIDSPNIRLLADLFHLKMMNEDLSTVIREAMPFIGHVQAAQAPGRNEPDTPGDIDYRQVFSLLQTEGYRGWVGLEYKPANSTSEGLKWVEGLGYRL